MEENRNNNEFNPRDNFVIIAAVVSFVVLVLMLAINYHAPDGKTFGLKSFYIGSTNNEPNYKELYGKLNPGADNSNACTTDLTRSENPTNVNSVMWVVEGQDIMSEDDIQNYAVDNDCAVIKPYTASLNVIVAPAKFEFTNTNISTISTKDRGIIIAGKIGEYVLEWDHCAAWFCHMGKPNPDKHTQVVGAGSTVSIAQASYILGQATSDTTVSLYKEDSNGNKTPCSFKELYRFTTATN